MIRNIFHSRPGRQPPSQCLKLKSRLPRAVCCSTTRYLPRHRQMRKRLTPLYQRPYFCIQSTLLMSYSIVCYSILSLSQYSHVVHVWDQVQFASPLLRRFNLIGLDMRAHGDTIGSVPLNFRREQVAEDVFAFMVCFCNRYGHA